MPDITVLLGFHNAIEGSSYTSLLDALGYDTDLFTSADEMIASLARRRYGAVIMDLNLGDINSPNIDPARRVYSALDDGIKFMGVSGNYQAIQNAKQAGIPAQEKIDFNSDKLIELLEE